MGPLRCTSRGKNCEGDSQKPIFRSRFSPLSWSNGCCSGGDKGGSLVANVKGRWQRIVVLIIIIIIIYNIFAKLFHSCEELRDEEGEKVKHEEDFQNCLFLDICHNSPHIHLWVHGHFSWSKFGLHLVKGPKVLKMHFLEFGQWKCDRRKMPFDMGELRGPQCKWPLNVTNPICLAQNQL